jgi:hypothetical protein
LAAAGKNSSRFRPDQLFICWSLSRTAEVAV